MTYSDCPDNSRGPVCGGREFRAGVTVDPGNLVTPLVARLSAVGAVLLLTSLAFALRRPPVARLVRGGTPHIG